MRCQDAIKALTKRVLTLVLMVWSMRKIELRGDREFVDTNERLRGGTPKLARFQCPLDALLDQWEDDAEAHLLENTTVPRMVLDNGSLLDSGEVPLKMPRDWKKWRGNG
jgi:hypothetical protein